MTFRAWCWPLAAGFVLVGCSSSSGDSGGGTGALAGSANLGGATASAGAPSQAGSGTAGTGIAGTASAGESSAGASGAGAGNAGASGGVTGSAGGSAASGGGSGSGSGGGGGAHTGFYVDGRYLYDRCGEKVLLRGINEMVIYSSNQDGSPYFSEMAKTGANSVRITWNTTGSPAKLGASIKNAIAAQMIPMPVLNDATGDITKLAQEVSYWTRSDVVSIVKTYEDKLLVNIGNEVGNGSVSDSTFTSSYQDAITKLRNAGIHTPLVIDGSSWGQNINQLQSTGPGLLKFDPDHNLLFSVHMYWNDPNGTQVNSEIAQSVQLNLPLIVGEFAQHAVSGCSSAPFAYKTLMSVAKTSEIGYLPWSWGGVKNSDCGTDQPFDMSNGTYAGLQGWGKEVAVTDPNSIQNTSVRPGYMTTGACK
jgi:mannan endo-1,4-beta-mannosidase